MSGSEAVTSHIRQWIHCQVKSIGVDAAIGIGSCDRFKCYFDSGKCHVTGHTVGSAIGACIAAIEPDALGQHLQMASAKP